MDDKVKEIFPRIIQKDQRETKTRIEVSDVRSLAKWIIETKNSERNVKEVMIMGTPMPNPRTCWISPLFLPALPRFLSCHLSFEEKGEVALFNGIL